MLALVLTSGCKPPPQKRAFNANADVKVTDHTLRRLTDVTARVELLATGSFTPGLYEINKTVLAIPPDTKFRLNLALPIKNPAVISTRPATGTLWTSQQMSVNGVPAPQTINLDEGKVTGEFDMMRSIGAFLINLFQVGVERSEDVRGLIAEMKVDEAKLDLRPGSTLRIGMINLHLAEKSSVRFTDVIVDRDLNYEGDCLVDVKFLEGCKWIGEKVDCTFDGGSASLHLRSQYRKDKLVLSLDQSEKSGKQAVVLANSKFRFGKQKRSSTDSDTCAMTVNDLSWVLTKDDRDPDMRTTCFMNFRGTHLNLKTDIHNTVGYFPGNVPARLAVTINDKGRVTDFNTLGPAHASSGKIIIAKKATRLVLYLSDVVLGPVAFDKSGSLEFSLQKGIAHLKQLDWQGNKSKFSLTSAGTSVLEVPRGMLLEKDNPKGPTQVKLPVNIKMGAAVINGTVGTVRLGNLNGKLLVDVDREIQLIGDLDFSIDRARLLDGQGADVKVRGLDISVVTGKTMMKLRNCRLLVSEEALQNAIAKRVPSHLEFDMDKVLVEDKKWRYRNAIAKRVRIENLTLKDMKPDGANRFNFLAAGDVLVDGTVEKGGIFSDEDDEDDWKVRPWKITGHVEGRGKVKYEIHAGDTSKNEVTYQLSMNLPVPEDVELDWSQVAKGIMKLAERKAILSRLRKLEVPVNHSGEIPLFKDGNHMWQNFTFSRMVIKPNGQDTQIEFVANANF